MSRSTILLLAVFAWIAACSSQDTTSDQPNRRDTSVSSRDTGESSETSPSPASDTSDGNDDTRDRSTDDSGPPDDASSDRGEWHYIHKLADNDDQFHYPVRSKYGVGSTAVTNKREGRKIVQDAPGNEVIEHLYLNDMSDPDDVEVVDWVAFRPGADIQSVVIGNSVLVVRDDSNENDKRKVEARFYDIRNGAFQKEFPAESLFEDSNEAALAGELLDLVHDGTRAVVVFQDRFVELSAEPQSNAITITKRVDRTPENSYLDDTGIVSPRDNYRMTSKGDILEVFDAEQSIAIWTLEPDQGDALLGRITREELMNDGWTYVSQSEYLYVGKKYDHTPEGTKYENKVTIYDLSTPSNPTVAATWHVKRDFPRTIFASSHLSHRNQRLYWSVGVENQYSDGRVHINTDGVYVIELGSDPTTLGDIRFIEGSSILGTDQFDFFGGYAKPSDDIVWFSYDRSDSPEDDPTFPDVEMLGVPRSELQMN